MHLLFTIYVAITACRVGAGSHVAPSRSVPKSSRSLLGVPTKEHVRSNKLALDAEERVHPFDLNEIPSDAEEVVEQLAESLAMETEARDNLRSEVEKNIEEVVENTRGTETDHHKLLNDEVKSSKLEFEKFMKLQKPKLRRDLKKMKVVTKKKSFNLENLKEWAKVVKDYNDQNPDHPITLSAATSLSDRDSIALALYGLVGYPKENRTKWKILDEIFQKWATSNPIVSATDAALRLGVQPLKPDVNSPRFYALEHYLSIINRDKRPQDRVRRDMVLEELKQEAQFGKEHASVDITTPKAKSRVSH